MRGEEKSNDQADCVDKHLFLAKLVAGQSKRFSPHSSKPEPDRRRSCPIPPRHLEPPKIRGVVLKILSPLITRPANDNSNRRASIIPAEVWNDGTIAAVAVKRVPKTDCFIAGMSLASSIHRGFISEEIVMKNVAR